MCNRNIDLAELKQLQLEMLIEVDKYCRQHKINYSLAYGTLLGAVRHGGYIPWDDDVDIMMPREDYERFMTGFCAPKMEAYSFMKTENYFLPFGKVVRTDTVLEENVSIKSNMGIYLDIFPIDVLPNSVYKRDLLLRKKKFLNALYQIKIVKISSKRSWLKNVILGLGKLMILCYPLKCLLKSMDKISRSCQNMKSDYYGSIVHADNISNEVYKSEMFSSYVELVFEGVRFKAVKLYVSMLTQNYGDYMQLPPVEKRVSHHSFNAYWK